MPNCSTCKASFDSSTKPTPPQCQECAWKTAWRQVSANSVAASDAYSSLGITCADACGSGSKEESFKMYLVDILSLDTAEQMVDAMMGEAKAGALIRMAQAFPQFLSIHLRSLDLLSIFKGIAAADMDASIEGLLSMAARTRIDVRLGKTEWDGTLHLSINDVKAGEAAMMFSMSHEFGHGCDMALKHPSLKVGQQIRKAVTTAADIGDTGFKNAEYFADAFGTLILKAAWGSPARIEEAADGSIGTELPTADYPSGAERMAKVRKVMNAAVLAPAKILV